MKSPWPLAALVLALLAAAGFAQPSTVFVDDDFDASTPGWNVTHFAAIQDGVNAVADPGTVRVAPGTYLENVVVGKSLQVIADGPGASILDGGASSPVVAVLGPSTRLEGLTIRNGGNLPSNTGARLSAVDVEVVRCRFESCDVGVFVEASAARGAVRACDIDGTYTGVRLEGVDGLVEGGEVRNCVIGVSVRAPDAQITGNVIEDCLNGVRAVEAGLDTNRPVIERNRISSPSLGLQGLAIYLASLSGAVVRHNVIHRNRDGLTLVSTNGCTIESNLIVANRSSGIFSGTAVQPASQNTLRENAILGHPTGVRIVDAVKDTYEANNVLGNDLGIDRQVVGFSIEHRFRDNDLINTQNAFDDGASRWSLGNPSHGNFWSDYTGVDGNADGVGDAPHPVPGGTNQDDLPWMEPQGDLPFWASVYEVSASQPAGPIALSLEAGASQAGRTYLIALSATGFEPGTPLPGGQATLPITADPLTSFALANINKPVFAGFLGTLDGNGSATAQLNLPVLPPVFVGRTFFLAAALATPWNRVSNAVPIVVRP